LALGISFVILWTTLVSLSRVYLGMHSVLDLVSGIAISSVLLAIFLPLTNTIEHFFATNVISPVMTLIIPVVLIVYFPTTEVWTPTR
jgi:membrane-associated phospholipid phosphatase